MKGIGQKVVLFLAVFLSILSTTFCYFNNYIIAYGDAESHLNIAKRVISCLTPGMAQLGGIWLPLPHLLLVPFVYFDSLWRTGLAGSLISGVSFIISSLVIYKLTLLLTKDQISAFISSLVLLTNPNLLYLQATPLTELTLIVFFLLNTYFFLKFIEKEEIIFLILASFFGFCATLCRYDGWFLVGLETVAVFIFLVLKRENRNQIEGKILLFITPAFFGIILWLLWNFLIFRDPFYFTNSVFSAKSQQTAWLQRNELPAYHNLSLSFLYYLVTSVANIGIVVSAIAAIGILVFLLKKIEVKKIIIALVLLSPFFFYVLSLYLGQSVIFIPSLTPKTFEWQLFNVRYGTVMIPSAAFFFSCFWSLLKKKNWLKLSLAILVILFQLSLYFIGEAEVITLSDGTEGLSAAKNPDAQLWLKKNYDQGLVLLDDYARTLSIIRTNIPMEKIIYVGTSPYWEESFQKPEKYATWIIMQKDDEVWKHLYDQPQMQARLYKYFNKVYTSTEILIFKKIIH